MTSMSRIAIAVFAVALVCAVVLIWTMAGPRERESTISYTQFLRQVQAGQVAEVKISARSSGADPTSIHLKDGTNAHTVLPSYNSTVFDAMQNATVNVEIEDASTSPGGLAINAIPFLILLAVWIFFVATGRPLLGRLRD